MSHHSTADQTGLFLTIPYHIPYQTILYRIQYYTMSYTSYDKCLCFLAGKRVTNKDEIKAISWSTWTGVLGTEVNGIWEKYTDTNDINATDTSFPNNTLVSGDDFGLVKLFRFPCIKKGINNSRGFSSCLMKRRGGGVIEKVTA